jgi:general secretion pathway protein B
MSSILKALKKLEDEKSIRKPDSLKIDAEILRGDASRRFSPMGVSLLAALLFICGSGATYVFMKPDTGNIESAGSAVTSLMTSSSATAVASGRAVQQTLNIQADSPKAGKLTSAGSVHKPGNDLPAAVKATKMTAKVQSVQVVKPSEVKQTVAPAQLTQATVIRPAAPPLKVNGIAFQDESADRVAIVNGVSVSNGSVIEGAKVEDIQKDRVRFSYGGEKFDVALGKSNR